LLAEQLRARIMDGEFGPGARLPSETAISDEYGVSRVTVRTAVKMLESQGLVDIRHGSGTYVCDFGRGIRAGLQELRSITDTISEMGFTPSMERHRIERRPATEQEATRLSVAPDAPVLSLERAIFADGEVVAYSYDVVPIDGLSAPVAAHLGSGSVFSALEKVGIVPVRAIAELHAVSSQDVAWGPQRPDSGLYLLLDQVHVDRSGTPVMYSKTYFVEGRFQFVILRTR
jgi:GntR family transcriptional regulator